MLAVTRKSHIKDILLEKKSVTVSELSKLFSVTEETVRRDLKQLEDEGFLVKTYGGAFIQGGVENDVALSLRETAYLKSKEAIALKAKELIHHGECIFLDSSTTALTIAKAIKDMRLTVVTHSLMVMDQLRDLENIHLICIGGNYSSKSKSNLGMVTLQALDNYYIDKTFMSCRSLSMEHGITDSNESLACIRQKLIQRSSLTYIIADFSKFDKTSFIHICDFHKIHGLITDKDMSDQWRRFLRERKVSLYECPYGELHA